METPETSGDDVNASRQRKSDMSQSRVLGVVDLQAHIHDDARRRNSSQHVYILENQQMRFPRRSLCFALRMTVATPSSEWLIVDIDGACCPHRYIRLWRVIIIYL